MSKRKILITIFILFLIILIDSIQGRILNNNFLLKITKEYTGNALLKKDIGILTNKYYCESGEEKVLFKWEKFICMDKNFNNSSSINDKNFVCRDSITGEVNMEELEEIREKIHELNDITIRKNLSSLGIDEENGVVNVGLIDNSLEKQEEFRKAIGVYKCITFIQEGPLYH